MRYKKGKIEEEKGSREERRKRKKYHKRIKETMNIPLTNCVLDAQATLLMKRIYARHAILSIARIVRYWEESTRAGDSRASTVCSWKSTVETMKKIFFEKIYQIQKEINISIFHKLTMKCISFTKDTRMYSPSFMMLSTLKLPGYSKNSSFLPLMLWKS